MKRLACIALLMTASSVAFAAGGTSSGGGNTLTNRQNPWFLENTKEVRYCIDIDVLNFGTDEEMVHQQIKAAIQYWKMSFAEADANIYDEGELQPYGQIRLATQTFIKVQCSAAVDLRFQMGILSADQIAEIGNPDEFIGLAYRTEYDPRQLKGKGFIYIAPSAGPLRPRSNYFGQNPWSQCEGCILKEVMKHELGHVFGIEHSHSESLQLMDEKMPGLLTSNEGIEQVAAEEYDMMTALFGKPFFHFDTKTLLISEVDKTQQEMFGLHPDETIFKIELRSLPENITGKDIRFLAASNVKGPFVEVGSLLMKEGVTTTFGFDSTNAITLFYSDEQQVFTRLPEDEKGVLMAYDKTKSFEFSAIFKSNRKSSEIPVIVRLNSDNRTLGTLVDGVIDLEFLSDNLQIRYLAQ